MFALTVLKSNQRTEEQILNKGVQSSTGKDGAVLPPCDNDWIWYQNKCYSFSEGYGNWTGGGNSCAALNSTLALIDTQDELNFMLRYKGDHNHWIGLRRDNRTQPWTWVNGTIFNNWFTISDTSECAYLSYGKVKSLECDITNKWICTRDTI
ncbi:C-type lectin domain family 2 member E-like [Lissotriton helveticus]